MWSGHSCPLLLTVVLGELSCKERSDEAGQFAGKRVGSAAAVAQKERSDAGATAKALRTVHYTRRPPRTKEYGPPEGGPLV